MEREWDKVEVERTTEVSLSSGSSKFLAAGVLGSAFFAPIAVAEPKGRVGLDYLVEASLEDCPGEAEFRAMIEGHLGYDPFGPRAPDRVVARIGTRAGSVFGTIEWRDAGETLRGERRLASETGVCSELARTMSFAVAVQVQLLERDGTSAASPPEKARARPSERRARGTTPPAAYGEPYAQETPAQAEPKDGQASLQLLLGAGALAATGIAPEWVVEARGFVSLRSPRWSLELGVETGFPSRHETSNDEGFEQHVVLGSSAGCVALPPFSACAVGKAGRLGVHGFGVDETRSSSGFIALFGPRLALEQGFGPRWLALVRLELLATLVPWRVELDTEEVWRTPAAAFFVGADVATIFE